MAPDRHSLTELHRSTVDSTGANVTDGFLAAADGAGNVEWIAPGAVGVTDHGALTGLADDDHSAYLKKIEGGQDLISAHGSMGATETFDPTAGNVQSGTLNADCTFTISAPVGSGMSTLSFWITQDGTGGWDITWPGSVAWDGGTPTPDTTAGVTVRYILESIDGGTTWIGNMVGGGGAESLGDLSDVTITTPAEDDTLRYRSGEWVNDNRRWEPVTFNFGTGPELVWDGDDLVMEWKEY